MTWRSVAGGVLLALMLAASGGSIAASAREDTGFGFRIGGGVLGIPISFGSVKAEGALAWDGPWALTGWAEAHLPAWTMNGGGDIRFVREWLSLRLSIARVTGSTEISAIARGEPSSWLLYDGVPTVVGGVNAAAAVTWSGSARSPEANVTITPSVTGIIPLGPITVSPSVEADLSASGDDVCPTVSGTRLTSTIDLGSVLLAHTASFAGWAETFESLVMALTVPEIGLTVSGALHHVGAGAFLYEIKLSYEWGNTSALPSLAGKPGKTCTGDVCF